MRRASWAIALFVAAAAVLTTAAPIYAQPITPEERGQLVKHLTSTRDQVIAEAEKLTEPQWAFKPGPDRWSVGEVVEHLALGESLIFEMQQKTLKGPDITTDQRAASSGNDDKILKMVADRTQKATAPEQIRPGQLGSRAQVLAAFKDRRAKTLNYAETTQDALRGHAAESPVFKAVDAYQWLLYLSAHTDRHLAQIREVKADPKFPKSSSDE